MCSPAEEKHAGNWRSTADLANLMRPLQTYQEGGEENIHNLDLLGAKARYQYMSDNWLNCGKQPPTWMVLKEDWINS